MDISYVFAAAWLLTVFVLLFVWLPSTPVLSPDRLRLTSAGLTRAFARMMLVTTVAASLLSEMQLLNAITLIAVYAVWALAVWSARHRHGAASVAQETLRHGAVGAAAEWERGNWQARLKATGAARVAEQGRRFRAQGEQWLPRRGTVIFAAILASIAITATLVLRFAGPLEQVRLGHPDGYRALLATQEFLAGHAAAAWPPAFPALAATLTLYSSLAPIHVVRVLGAIVGCLLVLAVAGSVKRLTGDRAAGLAAALVLGIYVIPGNSVEGGSLWGAELSRAFGDALTRQWAGSAAELGSLFVVLSTIVWHDARSCGDRWLWLDGMICIALVGLACPPLLPLAVIAAGTALFSAWKAMLSLCVAWLASGVAGAAFHNLPIDPTFVQTLPIALALAIGALFHLACRTVWATTRIRIEPALLTLVAIVSLLLMPQRVQGQYLEYDIAARKTLEIAGRFPAQRWLIVAPVEQLAQTYGHGGYEDLQQFVRRYESKADDPAFRLPLSVEHVFIFIEKKPFVTFSTEPMEVPFRTLTDPSYRYYRALAGRASVEYTALDFCERFRRSHPLTSIYYEDDVLRIYDIRPKP
jgi:hypothetical protein